MRFLSSLGLALVLSPACLFAQLPTGINQLSTAHLTGYQEVPAVSTDATGDFVLQTEVGPGGIVWNWSLIYSNLSVPASVTSVTINFAQENVNGGVLFVLCGNGSATPCDQSNSPKHGRIDPSTLQTLTYQNIAYDDQDKVLRALFAGKLYINIKTTRVTTGELRGQIKPQAFQ